MIRSLALAMLSLVFAASCSTSPPPTGVPRAEGPNPPPQGSSWLVADRNTGSFGSTAGQWTIRSLGEQVWQGRKVRAFDNGTVTSYVDLTTDGLLARTRGNSPVESFDPPFAWQWPIFPGKSWHLLWRYTHHDAGRSFTGILTWFKVESYEEVRTPAGTFKTFKVSADDGVVRFISWWSQELGISVKSWAERDGTHFLGPGTQETELISYDIKR